MGNVIRRCFGEFSSSDAGGQYPGQYPSQYPGQHQGQYQGQYQGPQYGTQGGAPGYPPAPPIVAADTAGFSLLARDLLQFETTNKVTMLFFGLLLFAEFFSKWSGMWLQ